MNENKLKEERLRAGLTAIALARAAANTEDRVYQLERGRFPAKPEEAARLAAALGVDVQAVFGPNLGRVRRVNW